MKQAMLEHGHVEAQRVKKLLIQASSEELRGSDSVFLVVLSPM